MIGHIRLIGILHIILGSLGMLVGLGILLLFSGLAGIAGVSRTSDSWVAVPVLGSIGFIVFTIASVLSLPSIVVGIGLLSFRPWARIVGIILSVLDLIHFPFGTALGAYGLWALLSQEAEMAFANPAAARVLQR